MKQAFSPALYRNRSAARWTHSVFNLRRAVNTLNSAPKQYESKVRVFIISLIAVMVAACSTEPLDEKISFDVVTHKLSYMNDYELAVDITLHNTGKSVVLFHTSEDNERGITTFPLFYANTTKEGKERVLRLKEGYRDEDDAGGMTFRRIVEFEAMPPGSSKIRYTLSSKIPISEISKIYFDLRIDAYDTRKSIEDLDLDSSMFGAAVNPEPYRDKELTFLRVSYEHTLN